MPITNALPGWSGYIGGEEVDRIVYNTRALDSATISIHDSGSDSFQPLLGDYSVFLQGPSFAAAPASAAISQSGQIPQDAKSLRFLASPTSSLEVMFAGQSIPLVEMNATATYRILGGDISAFAGQSGELRFSVLPQHSGLLDSIFFSPQPIPEPTVLGLSAVAAIVLVMHRWRQSSLKSDAARWPKVVAHRRPPTNGP